MTRGVPLYFRDFFTFVKSGEYERYDVLSALNPPLLWNTDAQLQHFRNILDEWNDTRSLKDGGFERELQSQFGIGTDWICLLKSGPEVEPDRCYWRFCIEAEQSLAKDQVRRRASGRSIYKDKERMATTYNGKSAVDILRLIRNKVQHPNDQFGYVPDERLVANLNADHINLGWRIFRTLLNVSRSQSHSRVGRRRFLHRVSIRQSEIRPVSYHMKE